MVRHAESRMSPLHYRLVIEGGIGPCCPSAFDALTVSAPNGTPRITGAILDASNLQGLLERIAGVGRPDSRSLTHSTPSNVARGKAARAEVPRGVHGEWSAPSGRRDPVELLEEQAASRVPELVPIRYGRMLVSPFTFYRGAAYLMAADLERSPRTGLSVQLC